MRNERPCIEQTKFLLLKIPTDPQYCERLTEIKRGRSGTLLSRYKIYNRHC